MTEPAPEPSTDTSGGVVLTLTVDDVGAQLVANRVLEQLHAAVAELKGYDGRVS